MSENNLTAHVSGFACDETAARLDAAVAAFRSGQISAHTLHEEGRQIRLARWQAQREAGLAYVAVNDFTLADPLLDLACTFGLLPERFGPPGAPVTLERYFQMGRGHSREGGLQLEPLRQGPFPGAAEERVIPELPGQPDFRLAWTKIIDETREAYQAGFRPKPVIIGPLSFLHHCGGTGDRLRFLDELLAVYRELLERLAMAGAEWVELQEPALTDAARDLRNLLPKVAAGLKGEGVPRLLLSLPGACEADAAWWNSFDGLHLPAAGPLPLPEWLPGFPRDKVLSLGVISGKNSERADLGGLRRRIAALRRTRALGNLWLGADGHLIAAEQKGGEQMWFSGSARKLQELAAVAAAMTPVDACVAANRALRKRQLFLTGAGKTE